MLTVRCLSRRTALSSWTAESHRLQRCFSDDRSPRPRRRNHQFKPSRRSREGKQGNVPDDATTAKQEVKKPSLAEQLFPELSNRHDQQQTATREVPPVPMPKVDHDAGPESDVVRQRKYKQNKTWMVQQLEAEMEAAGPGTAVLVLRNASPHLTEEDFRRLVPQGRHLEGWRLEQGDILKVIPGRNLATLAQQNTYYLLFTSALNAFTYQGHVQRIHNLAAMYTPNSASSPIPPPPEYMIEGLDAHAAIQAYTLVSPDQKLELRQLKPPLSPVMQTIVRHRGWKSIKSREDKMPFEARLTMEGPQLAPSAIRHILMESGRARGLSWNGGEGLHIKLTRWTPQMMPSPVQNDERAFVALRERSEEDQMRDDVAREARPAQDPKYAELARRTPAEVYILGFHTERAVQSFVAYWHRRPLEMPQPEDAPEWDTPPIANVSLLW